MSAPNNVLPLLLLVIGLAAATVWFVALPAFATPPTKADCEVTVPGLSSTACKPSRSSGAAQKSKSSPSGKR